MIRKDQKSKNPKIGRPTKTNQQEQFKNHYMINKKKFELQCQLLVCIHETYFDQIPCNPINRRVTIPYMTSLFSDHNCNHIYQILLRTNQRYFKNSSLFPEEKLRYTSIIDIAYLTKQVKEKQNSRLLCEELLLIIFFFLYNQKLVNKEVYEYYRDRMEIFKEAMMKGPSPDLPKLDIIIASLALQLAVREDIQIIVKA